MLAWLCSMRTRNSQHEDFDVGRWEAAFGCATERLQRVHAVPWAPQLGPDARARRGRCKSSPSVFFFFAFCLRLPQQVMTRLMRPGLCGPLSRTNGRHRLLT